MPDELFDDPSAKTRRKCLQCNSKRAPSSFIGKNGKVQKRCYVCSAKYRGWAKLSLEDRARKTDPRARLRGRSAERRYKLNMRSTNSKVGPIPVTGSQPRTCPPSCGLYGAGCYAEQFFVGMHWRRLMQGHGVTWKVLLDAIRGMPRGQLWRHNEMGDLEGEGEEIDKRALYELVGAASHTRGFTYTHKRSNFKALRWANENGFTINISTDSPEQADEYSSEGCPVTTVLPHNAPVHGNKTPRGLTIVVCPAEYVEGKHCANCGLCQNRTRGTIVGFRAHGDRKQMISERQSRQLPLFKEPSGGKPR
jgi:hypothetical protein